MNDQQVIQPGQFTPSSVEAPARRRITALNVALGLAATVLLSALVFLLTARSLTLTFDPPTAEHELSGSLLFELGGTYLAFPGDYTLLARAAGYEDLIRNVHIDSDNRNQAQRITLQPLPGKVSFTSTPVGASVVIDGEVLGTTPLIDQPLPAGEYSLFLRHPRYEDYRARLPVAGFDRSETHTIEMLPDWADISITSEPAGALISIDGTTTQWRTPATVPVPSGFAELTLKLTGYKSHTLDVEAVARQAQTLPRVELALADGLVSVVTIPPGAGITANGRFFGESPAELALRPGRSYKLQVYKAGFERIERTIKTTRGEQTLNLRLQPLLGDVAIQVEPSDAELTVDGRAYDSPNRTLRLPVRAHRFSLSKPGYAGYVTTLTPKTGLTQQLRVKLLTLEAARIAAMRPRRTSSAGDELVLLLGGEFTMGASRREPGRRANEVLHPVTLKRPFYLASKEVSNRQYQEFSPGHDSGEFEDNSLSKPDLPVVGVRWLDAAQYCNWLSERDSLEPFYRTEPGRVTGINPKSTGYRLPTEAEWAFAARTQPDSSELLRFPWGPKLPPPDRHGNYADRSATHLVGRIIFGYNDNHIVAAPVGTFAANQHAIYDLGGNVAEWTHDFYTMPETTPSTDPLGPSTGEYHVIRGSSWRHGTISELRLSFRDYGTDGRNDVGFRIARYAE